MNNDRRLEILEVKNIIPYLTKVNYDLYDLSASLRGEIEDDLYAHWILHLKRHLDFIASALTDEFGDRFGYCQDGNIFLLLSLYEDSLQIFTKSIQEKLVIKLLISVCTEVVINNGDGINDRSNYDYSLKNTRTFINHLTEEHARNKSLTYKNVWFDLKESNYILNQF